MRLTQKLNLIKQAGLVLVMTLCSWTAQASFAEYVTVAKVEDIYVVRAAFIVDARVNDVYDIFTDYANLAQLNQAVKNVALISSGDREATVKTTLRECLFVFCKNLILVENIVEERPCNLISTVVPDQGSFSEGWAQWTFADNGGKTFVTYESEKHFNSMMIPLVGTREISARIERNLRSTVANAERIASAAGLVGNNDPENISCI